MKRVEKLFYRILTYVFSEVETPELLAKLVDVVCSSGGSNQNPQSLAMLAASSSMPLGASLSMPVIAPEAVLIASPSFAADLNYDCDGQIGSVEDVLREEDDDDVVEHLVEELSSTPRTFRL
ncbi:hypothetical protein Ahy_B08g093578 [Arachis hypogaea]|uniref:Uncharacterized protein n=1 Tax=Arachis hypogaea TaxID=3818 RepID=A0A444Y6G1_ARAHY|nr:hypothetical protein Ahy_B08g093578 [Arachis hypogaea]